MNLLFFTLISVILIFVKKFKLEGDIRILQDFGYSVTDNVFADEKSRVVFIINHKHSVIVWRNEKGRLLATHYLIQRVSFIATLPADKVETELYNRLFLNKEDKV